MCQLMYTKRFAQFASEMKAQNSCSFLYSQNGPFFFFFAWLPSFCLQNRKLIALTYSSGVEVGFTLLFYKT